MDLRPYQRAAIDALYTYFATHNGHPLIVLPTGTGKSVVIANFCQEAIETWPETRILMITHVSELIAQNYAALVRAWPDAPAGIYSASLNKRDTQSQILFCGIQSVYKRAFQIQRADLVLVDEAHLIGRTDTGMYQKFLADLRIINPAVKVIGFTATPYRMDTGLLHEGKDRLFTDIAYQEPVLRMIEQGYLCPVISKATETMIDVSGVHLRGGDFVPGELERAAMAGDTSKLAVQEIVAKGKDRGSWLIFCAGVDHAIEVRNAVRAHGIDCETVTGDTPAGERAAILSAFKSGRLRAVTNMNVLTTGFDATGVDLIALLRPTKSVGLYAQMIGRGTRIAPGKDDCLVLDFAGNVMRHGPIDRLDGRLKNKNEKPGDAPVKTCPECNEINHASVRQCTACGYEFPPPKPEIAARASDAPILSTQAIAKWLDVSRVSYMPHAKEGKPTSMRVDYHCGIVRHSEWICFDHSGYPRQKACDWWRHRAITPVPITTAEALSRTVELRTPSAIKARPVGKYVEIVDFRFDR